MKKILLSLCVVLMTVGAWAQEPVVTVTEINDVPFKLDDADAAKIFNLTDVTIVCDITTNATLDGRGAFFCVADPAQAVPESFSGSNTSYMACGHNGAATAYIAAAKGGQHFSSGTIPAASTLRIAYVLDCTNNKFKAYIGNSNGWEMDRNFGNYEIATPKLVKEDFPAANIYIGGGMVANTSHELGDAIIHAVRVFDGSLTIEQIKALEDCVDYVTYTYEFIYEGKSYGTQEMRGIVGTPYATPELPVGVVGTVPEGNIEENVAGTTIEVPCTLSNCPVEFAADANSITKWYYLRLHSNQTKYIQYLEGQNFIEWKDASFGAEEIDSHLWGLVGNPFEAKLISKAANAGVVSTGTGDATVGADATVFYMAKSSVSGADKFTLQFPDGEYLNGQDTRVKHWSASDAGSTFVPTLYEVNEVNVPATDFATLYMGYQAYIPEGVEAYVVSSADSKRATLTKIEGILPANTGIILKNDGNYSFKKAIGTAADVAGNLLKGSATDTEVTGAGYVLSTVNSVTGFYVAKLTNGKFQNNAGKAYLPASAVTAGARFLSFDFGTETAIENIEGAEDAANTVVYDLSGRRVQKAQKGLYIVNGKVVIK